MCKIEHLIKKILEAEGVIDNPIKYSLSYSGKWKLNVQRRK